MTTVTVDVVTGDASGDITTADQIEFTSNDDGVSPGTQITVYAQLTASGSPWFEASNGKGHIQFNSPGPSAAVQPEDTGTWTWAALGVQVDANAHVNVGSGFPASETVKKAS